MMAKRRLCLVASASSIDLVRAIAAQIPISGLAVPGRSRMQDPPVELSPSVDSLLKKTDTCCFLTPYPALKRDVERALASSIHVLCAGPVPLNRAEFDRIGRIGRRHSLHFEWGPQPRHSQLHEKLMNQLHMPAFGEPVYLRWAGGGGDGLLPAWWAACRALEQTVELLDDEIEGVRLAAVQRRRRYHLALTVGVAGGATAQLVVAPFHHSPAPDIALLGTGGLLSSTSLSSAPLMTTRRGSDLLSSPEQWPEVAWLREYAQQMSGNASPSSPAWPSVAYHRTLLEALHQAIRQGEPRPVPGFYTRLSSPAG